MKNLDDYFSTSDELFNRNAHYWYLEFTGNNKPNTDKPYELFVKALYDSYFFIQDNLNKPFSCIEKINTVSDACGFAESEKLILLDKILGILYYHPKPESQEKVYIQLTDFRNDLSPYLSDPEIQNPNWHFDIDAIKDKFHNLKTISEKQKYLINLLHDYSIIANEIDELELMYYEYMGFVKWMKTELSRCKYEKKIKTIEKSESNFFNNLDKSKNGEKEKLSNLITHQNNEHIIESVKIQYKNIRGKRLKLLLMAFQDLGLLPNERIAKRFHNCCKSEFGWDIASYAAMNDYQYNENTDKEEFNEMRQYLESLIKTN